MTSAPAIETQVPTATNNDAASTGAPPCNILLGIPCGTRSLDPLIVNAIANLDQSRHAVSVAVHVGSALTWNFNHLWCTALNARKTHGITHFAMLHSDIVPRDPDWIDKLVDELWNSKKQIVSVAMPIKDGQGLSSVALDTHKWRPRRLTMKELAGLPATFDNESLHHNLELKRHIGKPNGPILFNTGLWIADIRGRWPEGVCFDINNEIRCLNDEFVCEFEPEDWLFSRWCYNHEVPYAVTRAVKADHVGSHAYPNYETWGHDRDEQNIAVVEPPQAETAST